MRNRLILLAGFLLLGSVIMVGPVAAATSGTAYAQGTLAASVSIVLNQSAIFLNLDPTASPATNTSLGVTVSSNVPNFHVTVRDSSSRASDIGFMGNWTPSAYVGSPNDTNLTQPLSITGNLNGTTSGGTVALLTATGQNLFSGGGKETNQLLTTQFSQAVTVNDDVLPANYEYRINLEFVITTT